MSEKARYDPIASKRSNIPTVPDGWLAKWDDRYNEWYYVNLKTKQSQWEAPPQTDFGGPPPGPPPSAQTNRSQQSQPQPQQPASMPQQHPYYQPQMQPRQQAPYYPQQPQPQYYPQQPQPQPVIVQQQPARNQSNGYGRMALGAGGGLLGGMILGDMIADHNQPDVVNNYYGGDGNDFGGGYDDGGFDGGFDGGDF